MYKHIHDLQSEELLSYLIVFQTIDGAWLLEKVLYFVEKKQGLVVVLSRCEAAVKITPNTNEDIAAKLVCYKMSTILQ